MTSLNNAFDVANETKFDLVWQGSQSKQSNS